jgi:hypothetical protein
MPFSETWICFFKKLDLLLCELYILAVFLLFQAKKAFVSGFHTLLQPYVTYCTGAYSDVLQAEMITDTYRAPGRMIKGKFDNLSFHFSRSFIGEGLWDRRAVHQPLEAPFLESSLVFIELATGNTVVPTGF